ncbi:MAG: ABC transporter permease [Bacteroidales bacterium]|nr:ABC transporter permease [Bacteroidales bacterium]
MFDLDRWQEIYITLKKNKVRTFFTAFGVFWGIFMLIIMLGSGNGLQNGANAGFGDMATNSMFMWTQQTSMPYKGLPRGRYYNFDNSDTRALTDQIPEIEYIAPRLQGWAGEGGNNVIRAERTGAYTIQGDYPAYNLIEPLNILKGRFINQGDIDEKRKVCVIGERVKNELFNKDEDPIGQYIQVQGVYFQVCGIFSSRKKDRQAEQENQTVMLPFTTLQKTYNYGDRVGWYSITAKKGIAVSSMEEKIKSLMRQRHKIHPDDKRAVGSFNLENEYLKMQRLFSGISILVWIVGIGTLMAGVIGISNIMLVVVKERTREIGVQRAIGASPWIIVSQILMESVILTSFAGYFGLVAGVGVLEAVNMAISGMNTETMMFANPNVSFQVAVTALIILVFSGALAGIIPARKAVTIKPIDALRYEM